MDLKMWVTLELMALFYDGVECKLGSTLYTAATSSSLQCLIRNGVSFAVVRGINQNGNVDPTLIIL